MNIYKLLYPPKRQKEVSIWKKNDEKNFISIFNNQKDIFELNIIKQSVFDLFKYDFVLNKILDVANDFIIENELSQYVIRGCNLINKIMNNNALDYEITIDITKDIESYEWKALRVLVEVFNVNYDDLLNIWNEVSTKLYSELDPKDAKKMYLIFRKKKRMVTYVV